MKRQIKQVLSGTLAAAMTLSLVSAGGFAAQAATGSAGGFSYESGADGVTVVGVSDSLKGTDKGAGTAILIPAELDGQKVTAFGNGGILLTNYEGDVIFPEGVTTIADGSIYDVGNTGSAYFGFPATISAMTSKALQSTKNRFLSKSDTATSACETFGLKQSGAETKELKISGGDNGEIYPNGTYTVEKTDTASFGVSIEADLKYAIDTLTVDGNPISEASGENTYTYTAAVNAGDIEVSFKADEDDDRQPGGNEADEYVAPAIVEGAVADGVELPENVNEYCADMTGENPYKYISTMGVETGTYYAVDGVIYRMVAVTQNVLYRSQAEVINSYYKNENMVYGKDYDLIRIYNYVHSYANGPRPGDFDMYCCYLYKSVGAEVDDASTNPDWEGFFEHCDAKVEFDENGMITSATKLDGTDKAIQGDIATVMIQKGSTVTFNDLKSENNTVAYGPSEAANFYGLGSAVLVDGGNDDSSSYKITSGTKYSFNTETDASSVILNNPSIIGMQNVLYAVASGTAYVNGGRFFGCSSGGHGFYVGMGGKIAINADSVLNEDGQAIIDTDKLKATERPALDLGTAAKNTDADSACPAMPVFADGIKEGTSVLVTADETGTALTTDTGGGVVVANNLSATTYGRGCAGVYSIGADESYVFVYNSALHSNMDAALCSASNGYIFAYNTELKGVDGLKTRSGGSGEWSGITVYNSEVTCEFNPENYKDLYDMATPEDSWPEAYKNWKFADDKSLVNCPMLNLFINKTNAKYGSDLTETMANWYENKNVAPQTGEAIAPICSTGSAPVNVYSTRFVNNNYANYKDQGAQNILIGADNAATGTISFYDCNSSTKWDLTGKSNETTELEGNINIAAIVTMTGPDAGSGASQAPVNFYNSEWRGSVTGYGKGAMLTFDENSKWTVDTQWADNADTVAVKDLTLAKETNVVSDKPVTVKVLGTLTIAGQVIDLTKGDKVVGNVTYTVAKSAVFSDMNGAYAWAAEAVDNLYYNSVVAGTSKTTYTPERKLSRQEMAVMIYNMCDRPAVEKLDCPFRDVDMSDSNVYRDAIVWAFQNHVVAGTSASTFSPEDEISRQDAMVMIYQAKQVIGYDLKEAEKGTDPLARFTDVADVADYAVEAVKALSGAGLVNGNPDGTLAPRASLTRAEMGCLLNNVFDAIPKSSGMMPPPGMDMGGPGGPGGAGGPVPPPAG